MIENNLEQSQQIHLPSLTNIESSLVIHDESVPNPFGQESEYEKWFQSNLISFQLEDGVIDLNDDQEDLDILEVSDSSDEQQVIDRFKRSLTPEEEANEPFRFGIPPSLPSHLDESYSDRFCSITADVPFSIPGMDNAELLRSWLLSVYEMNPFSFYVFDNPFHLSWSESNINQSNEDNLLSYLSEAITLIENLQFPHLL
jgi:hypothetical protein